MQINSNYWSSLLNAKSIESQNIYQKISSGKRINNAMDDPAMLAVIQRMQKLLNGMQVGDSNLGDAGSYVAIGDSSTKQAQNILGRMRELAVQADNGTNSPKDLQSINNEMGQLKQEYDHTIGGAQFNGKEILNNQQTVSVNDGNGHTSVSSFDLRDQGSGGVDLSNLDVTTPSGIQDAFKKIDSTMDKVTTARSSFGSDANIVNIQQDVNGSSEVEQAKSLSRAQDADIAKATSELIKNKLSQTSTLFMMKQQGEMTKLLSGL